MGKSTRQFAAATAAAVVTLGFTASAGGAAASTSSTQSPAQQITVMHKLELMAYLAAVGGVEKGTGLPTGHRLLTAIVSDQPSLGGIVTLQRVGSRGHMGVGQTTPNQFLAVATTPDGSIVRYTGMGVQGLG